jgi:3-phenylpropionate/trans-cinnamate dioxygenase ferredoxin reductase subunit
VPGLILRTWQDATVLRAELTPDRTLVVLGAGLIGCEVAASARGLGVQVHVVDTAAAPMTRVLGSAAARLVDLHREHGVQFHLQAGVESVDSDGVLRLSDGAVLRPDIVLHAVGVQPDVAWLQPAGITGPEGITCDSVGRTALPDVYALGDAACWDGVRGEHWSAATEQADRLAAHLTGHPVPEPDVPYWWSDQYDLKIQGLGTVRDSDDTRVLHWGPQRRTIVLYANAGRLVGVVGFSAAGAVMKLRHDIQAGTPIDEIEQRLHTTTASAARTPASPNPASPGQASLRQTGRSAVVSPSSPVLPAESGWPPPITSPTSARTSW